MGAKGKSKGPPKQRVVPAVDIAGLPGVPQGAREIAAAAEARAIEQRLKAAAPDLAKSLAAEKRSVIKLDTRLAKVGLDRGTVRPPVGIPAEETATNRDMIVAADREAMIKSLAAVLDWMRERKAPASYADNLLAIYTGLCDVHEGRHVAVFEPAVSKGQAAGVSDEQWKKRGYIALGVFALMRSGETKAAALAEAAKRLETCRRADFGVDTDKFITTGQIADWRDELNRGRAATLKGSGALKEYEKLRLKLVRKVDSGASPQKLVAYAWAFFGAAIDRNAGPLTEIGDEPF